MTALKPIENRRVRGVASERYPVNERCAHPDCTDPATTHHIFPRSLTKSDSFFVEITEDDGTKRVIPHAIGLCGSGTTGHHGDVEEHSAWIKLEDDGLFYWYDRTGEPSQSEDYRPLDTIDAEWSLIGPLNPQPGSREGKPKKKRTVKGTAARAARKTVSVRLPEGVDGDYWDELVEQANDLELKQPDTQYDPTKGNITIGKLLVALLERFVGRHGE